MNVPVFVGFESGGKGKGKVDAAQRLSAEALGQLWVVACNEVGGGFDDVVHVGGVLVGCAGGRTRLRMLGDADEMDWVAVSISSETDFEHLALDGDELIFCKYDRISDLLKRLIVGLGLSGVVVR